MSALKTVSFDDEPLILVDENDRVLGYDSKWECHQGRGKLHRAFSVFVFNSRNQVLMQKRSAKKALWPMYWSNSCCSHPRRGETESESVHRRLQEELSLTVRQPRFLYQFQYHALFGDAGAEHELCSVYIGRSDGPIAVNGNEVADYCYLSPEALDQELKQNPGQYTPWLQLEWPRLRDEFWSSVDTL